MKAALRDATFYACSAGHGHNPRPPRWHAIVRRPGNKYGAMVGPACGIPFHNEDTEVEADTIAERQRCGKPGCRAAFKTLDSQAVGNG
ncbi:hypothetical protein [Stenotrophomonas maltophilia]|uniref:hypothetical protein n=1 Tax=Stenotrophomonas maltophilia TaxID=40324 RepID=UPI0013DA102D|nr:hypothetical protein [Stenotrophomonas maltophilia]